MKKFLAVFIILAIIVLSCFLIMNKSCKEDSAWSPSDRFNKCSYVEIKKTPGKDFVILNLADIQLSDGQLDTDAATKTFALIDQAIKDQNPDLITLSGDNAIGTSAYLKTIEFIDSYGIPWAAVMGNHDGEGCTSEDWAAEQLSGAKNSLFKLGPKEMGHGNYVINIKINPFIDVNNPSKIKQIQEINLLFITFPHSLNKKIIKRPEKQDRRI